MHRYCGIFKGIIIQYLPEPARPSINVTRTLHFKNSQYKEQRFNLSVFFRGFRRLHRVYTSAAARRMRSATELLIFGAALRANS